MAYLPFSSPLSLSLSVSRWYLAQGCTMVHCDSTARDLRGRVARLLCIISRIRRMGRIIDYSNRRRPLYFITLEWALLFKPLLPWWIHICSTRSMRYYCEIKKNVIIRINMCREKKQKVSLKRRISTRYLRAWYNIDDTNLIISVHWRVCGIFAATTWRFYYFLNLFSSCFYSISEPRNFSVRWTKARS